MMVWLPDPVWLLGGMGDGSLVPEEWYPGTGGVVLSLDFNKTTLKLHNS